MHRSFTLSGLSDSPSVHRSARPSGLAYDSRAPRPADISQFFTASRRSCSRIRRTNGSAGEFDAFLPAGDAVARDSSRVRKRAALLNVP